MTIGKETRRELIFCVLLLATAMGAADAQRVRGELHLEVRDPQGDALTPNAELDCDVNQLRRTFQVAADGRYIAQDLPFGIYRLSISAPGFAPWTSMIEIRSEVQRQTLNENMAAQPGRGLSDLVNDLPGWLYEGNGVLHPRGAEYDVQYVVDGLPLLQNRSPAVAPSFDPEDVESMRVLTATFPPEYGRKLGGVVEVTTRKDVPSGLHGQLVGEGGSFSTASGFADISYSQAENRFSLSADGFHTYRYLDPPVLANYTNRANANGFSASYERDFSDRDRLRITVSQNAAHFLVPNEMLQQEAGQRQDIANTESSGQIYFQHTVSSDLLLSFAGSVRNATTNLSSNSLATPVVVSQDRGYREGYARGDLAGHHGRHEWKVGADGIFDPVRERLQYTITDPTQFDPHTQKQFDFTDHKWDVESSAYVQDQVNLSKWNLAGGLRFDHYGFVVRESAWSPRIAVSRYVTSLNLLVHASYDRVFQIPAAENLLLASSPQFDSINPIVVRLPVQPAHANYYEAGVTTAFFGKARLEANVFRRDFRNYVDDDVLLDTGISFPIAFANARIAGEELRLEIPRWDRFSGYLSYANQSGIGQGPITGGLFIGSDAASGLIDTTKFAVSQDQRNTARARVRFQAPHQVWLAVGGEYGSGLPADTGSANPSFLLAQYGEAILDRVNLTRGRVRPNFSLDGATGVEVYRKEQRSASFLIQADNLNNRINVINFASLFSGTAVRKPRSISALLRLTF